MQENAGRVREQGDKNREVVDDEDEDEDESESEMW